MTRDEIKEALRGRLRCIHASAGRTLPVYRCGNTANAGGHGAGYMASGGGGICRLMGDVARGSTCAGCDYTCGSWHGKLLKCRDDGEAREVLRKACVGWTPPAATNRIPGEAEP